MDFRIMADKNLLFYTMSGSHAYGMNTATSDEDYRGVFFLPREVLISPFYACEQVEGFRGEKDSTVFELKKYVKLLTDQNPNIMELLWVDDKFIEFISPEFRVLWRSREVFLSKKAKHTFMGYAISQLDRIKGHNKWINNPQPLRRPKEVDFVSVVWNSTPFKQYNKEVPFKGYTAWSLGNDIYGLMSLDDADVVWHDIHEALVSKPVVELQKSDTSFNFDLIVKFNKQQYKEAVDNWQHYWQWKKERNETRSALEEQFGYDTKHAAHLIRLLRMGNEIMDGKGVIVLRPDAQELLDIRGGKFTYEELMKEAYGLKDRLDEVYQTSKLQDAVDIKIVNEIYTSIYKNCWNRVV